MMGNFWVYLLISSLVYTLITWGHENYLHWDFCKWIKDKILKDPEVGGMFIAVMDNSHNVLVLFEIPPGYLIREGNNFWLKQDVSAVAHQSGRVAYTAFLDSTQSILGVAKKSRWSMFDTIEAGAEYTIRKAK